MYNGYPYHDTRNSSGGGLDQFRSWAAQQGNGGQAPAAQTYQMRSNPAYQQVPASIQQYPLYGYPPQRSYQMQQPYAYASPAQAATAQHLQAYAMQQRMNQVRAQEMIARQVIAKNILASQYGGKNI